MGKVYNQQNQTNRRKELRNNTTKTEKLLKKKQLGEKFRRQYGVGPYILDFYCIKKKMAIEIDGGSHFTPEGKAYDNERDDYLNELNISVLRFTNHEILDSLESVLIKIKVYLNS
jgi:very-short-patch-repair endonuclease